MLKGRLIDQETANNTDIKNILKLAKHSHEEYLIRARESDLESALIYYFQAIKIDPSISEAYYKLASLMWEKGQIDLYSAIEQCEKAIKLDPKSPTARLYFGYFLKAAGKFEEAEEEFKHSIKLGGIFYAKPRIALGSTIIENSRTNTPSMYDFTRGMCHFISGIVLIFCDFNAIKMFCKSVIEDVRLSIFDFKANVFKKFNKMDKVVEIYEKAAEYTEKNDHFYSKIGDLSIENGDPNQAANYYRDALKSSPENIALWTKLASIIKHYDGENTEELFECNLKIAELSPDNAKIHYELGHLYLNEEDIYSAVASFKEAASLDKKNPYYHNSLAYAYVQVKDYESALNEYQKAIRLNPDNEWSSIVSQAIGAIYHQIKDNTDAAITAYQSATVLDPLNLDAFIALAEIYQEIGDYNNAIDNYLEAIKLDPTIARVYCNLGLALWEKDYAEEAIIAYQKATALDSTYEIAYNNLGVAYLESSGQTEDALEMFTKAIKINPNYALAYYNKGRAYQVLGNKTEAANYYQMAIDINKLTDEFNESEVETKLFDLFTVN
jgi:tetratricopeptide (TPR) repeat protein